MAAEASDERWLSSGGKQKQSEFNLPKHDSGDYFGF